MNINKDGRVSSTVILGQIPAGVPFSGKIHSSEGIFILYNGSSSSLLLQLDHPSRWWSDAHLNWHIENCVIYNNHELILR